MILMAKPFFNKDIPPACEYCRYGHKSDYSDDIFCSKRGVTSPGDSCRRFRYDVLKRTPRRTTPSGEFKPEDFEL